MRITFSILMAALLGAVPAAAHEHGHHVQLPPGCSPGDTALRCAATATPTFAPDGTLLLAWTAGGRVMVARSADHGATLGPAVAANPAPEDLDAGGEARAALAADGEGRVVVAYAVRQQAAYTGRVMVARSTDGGRTFSTAAPLVRDHASQRFPVLAGAGAGNLTLAWIDKRGAAAAKAAGRDYSGAALAVARSSDGGATFQPERLVAEHSCECCRIGLALDAKGRPVLLWRHVFPGGFRDHAVAVLDGGPVQLHRVSEDNWRIDGCPHHGGAVAVDPAGVLHVAWYSGGGVRRGLFAAHSADYGRTFSAPRPLGDPKRQPSHPQVLAAGGRIWLAWSEFDGERLRVMVQSAKEGGSDWSAPVEVASTADAADEPLLVGDGHRPWLSWLTRAEGWRLLLLGQGGSP